jgi:hypothetical protein
MRIISIGSTFVRIQVLQRTRRDALAGNRRPLSSPSSRVETCAIALLTIILIVIYALLKFLEPYLCIFAFAAG